MYHFTPPYLDLPVITRMAWNRCEIALMIEVFHKLSSKNALTFGQGAVFGWLEYMLFLRKRIDQQLEIPANGIQNGAGAAALDILVHFGARFFGCARSRDLVN